MNKNQYIELKNRIDKIEATLNKLILLIYGLTTPRNEDSKNVSDN